MKKECPTCRKLVPEEEIEERYSFRYYAGRFCNECCYSYADHCGLTGRQGDPMDLDEPAEEESWFA
jgi:hypothetical protein